MAGDAKFSVSLEDHVSGPSKAAGSALHGLAERLHEARGALVATVEPVEVARHAIEAAEKGIKGFGAALKSGDVVGGIESATEAVSGLASSLDLLVPGLGKSPALR